MRLSITLFAAVGLLAPNEWVQAEVSFSSVLVECCYPFVVVVGVI